MQGHWISNIPKFTAVPGDHENTICYRSGSYGYGLLRVGSVASSNSECPGYLLCMYIGKQRGSRLSKRVLNTERQSWFKTIRGQRKCFYSEFHALSDHQKTAMSKICLKEHFLCPLFIVLFCMYMYIVHMYIVV